MYTLSSKLHHMAFHTQVCNNTNAGDILSTTATYIVQICPPNFLPQTSHKLTLNTFTYKLALNADKRSS